MNLTRRQAMGLPFAAALARTASARSGDRPARVAATLDAIAFDGLALFDPRPVWAKVGHLFPERGAALAAAWRSRQFEYQWLRALAGQYVDFEQATADALRFAAREVDVTLGASEHTTLMQAFAELEPWPDVEASLKVLRARGLRLSVLSNFTPGMLQSALRRAGTAPLFEQVISTHAIRSYKPAAAAYQLACDALALPRERIGFVAFAGWDAAGARWFGYPTYWLNRAASRAEELGGAADFECRDMAALLAAVRP